MARAAAERVRAAMQRPRLAPTASLPALVPLVQGQETGDRRGRWGQGRLLRLIASALGSPKPVG